MSQDNFNQKLTRRLGIALALSGLLNIGLLAFGLYEWQEGGFSYLVTAPFKPQKAKLYRQEGKELATLTQSLRELESLDFSECCTLLEDEMPVAEGYKKRDLALSVLVVRHFFDLEKALGSAPTARRLIKYMSQDKGLTEIVLYPDLSNEQYQSCIDFANSERWPYTAEGLYILLKGESDESLKNAFMLTDEYRVVELLLCRASEISRDEVFQHVMKSDWQNIKSLFEEMRQAQDFSPVVRRSFLVKTLPSSSDLLVKCEPRYSLHSLKDKETLSVLATLRPENAKEYALGLLELPRSQAVWQQAVVTLCTVNGLDPTKETRQTLLQRFGRLQAPKEPATVPALVKPQASKPLASKLPLPQKQVVKIPTPKAQSTQIPPVTMPAPKMPTAKVAIPKVQATHPIREVLYKVQAGDTLWHISKRFGIDVQVIKKHNKLTSDALKPGSTLRIPQPTKP